MSKKVVYNHNPDPVTKITVFEIDKPEPNKIYSLTGVPGTKCIANGSTWKESEFKEKDSFDTIDHLEKRMLLNEQMEDN